MISAIIFGLISSLHCVGMCGPIALMLPISRDSQAQKVKQILTYHLGRLSTYSILGLVFGALGKGFYLAGLQQQVTIIVGVLMIVFVLLPTNKTAKFNILQPLYRGIKWIKKSIGIQFQKKSNGSLYLIGFFNGFLPCGMVYIALFGALATQSIGIGMLYMFFFGLGTIPLMSLLVYFKNIFSERFRKYITKYYPFIIVLIGMLFIIRGLGLDIPYMSPDTLSLFVRDNSMC